jgi:hypothetical protein
MHRALVRISKSATVSVLIWSVWFVVGSLTAHTLIGDLVTIASILVYLTYAWNLAQGKKSLLKREFVPVVVTSLMAYLVPSPVDTIGAILTWLSLFARSYDLYFGRILNAGSRPPSHVRDSGRKARPR